MSDPRADLHRAYAAIDTAAKSARALAHDLTELRDALTFPVRPQAPKSPPKPNPPPSEHNARLGAALRAKRAELRLTQTDAANAIGCSPWTICEAEHGRAGKVVVTRVEAWLGSQECQGVDS